MSKSEAEQRDVKVLSVLLEHPYLHQGLTGSEAFHYLLGRMHLDRRSEKWRFSVRSMSYWLKAQGFEVDRSGPFHKYYWTKPIEFVLVEPTNL